MISVKIWKKLDSGDPLEEFKYIFEYVMTSYENAQNQWKIILNFKLWLRN